MDPSAVRNLCEHWVPLVAHWAVATVFVTIEVAVCKMEVCNLNKLSQSLLDVLELVVETD